MSPCHLLRSTENEVPTRTGEESAGSQGESRVQDLARDSRRAPKTAQAPVDLGAGGRVLLRLDQQEQQWEIPRHGQEAGAGVGGEFPAALDEEQGICSSRHHHDPSILANVRDESNDS